MGPFVTTTSRTPQATGEVDSDDEETSDTSDNDDGPNFPFATPTTTGSDVINTDEPLDGAGVPGVDSPSNGIIVGIFTWFLGFYIML